MNQNPEQLAKDEIDRQLIACGWVIQDMKTLNLSISLGVVKSIYRLFKFTKAKLALFLKKTRIVGEQTKQELKMFEPVNKKQLSLQFMINNVISVVKSQKIDNFSIKISIRKYTYYKSCL
jgi:type I restriction enzyme, R subunit